MEPWQVILSAVIAGSVPGTLLWLLNRSGANKRLEIEEGGLTVNQFTAQTEAYRDLLNRATGSLATANESLATANTNLAISVAELAKYKEEREALMKEVEKQGKHIEELQEADSAKSDELADTRDKLERLRALFTTYVARTGIPLTPDEKAIFEDTQPRHQLFKSKKEIV